MLSRLLAAALAATTLAACDPAVTTQTVAQLEWDNLTAKTNRAVEESYFELPFTRGVIAVTFADHGRLGSDRLYPCASGTAVCLNSPRGAAAQVLRTDYHYIVDFGHRTFFLRPGGGGTLRTHAGDAPLAWNAYINGVPAWPAPAGLITVAQPEEEADD